MISIKNLSLAYKNKVIFDNAEIEIPNNKLTVLIGANGTGKTTLFRIIKGQKKINNCILHNDFKKTFFLPQTIKYPENLTLFEYITSFFYSDSLKWFISEKEKQKTEEVLNLLEIQNIKDVMLENLSSGELQKANIAIALLSDADCLLLDEPTSNMDLVNQIKILDILKKLKNHDITCVIIMHDLNTAAHYGDYFIGIDKNKKTVCLEKNDFFKEENLKNIFEINLKVTQNEDDFNIQVNN